jgi:excisionase family DNA binding protein
MTVEPLVTVDYLASHVGVSTRTLRSWYRDKGMPHYAHGKSVRFRLSEVEEWMRADRESSSETNGRAA